MTAKKLSVDLRDDTLTQENLKRIKWCATIAIIGFPVMVQILGAMILFSNQHPALLSMPALLTFAGVTSLVIGSGIYAVTNRLFLRFSGMNRGLEEWESKIQSDAFTFSYRIIVKGALLAFVGISVLGVIQLLNLVGWINFDLGHSIVLNIEGLAAFTVVITYLILLMPTLYIAWTITPLNVEELADV